MDHGFIGESMDETTVEEGSRPTCQAAEDRSFGSPVLCTGRLFHDRAAGGKCHGALPKNAVVVPTAACQQTALKL